MALMKKAIRKIKNIGFDLGYAQMSQTGKIDNTPISVEVKETGLEAAVHGTF